MVSHWPQAVFICGPSLHGSQGLPCDLCAQTLSSTICWALIAVCKGFSGYHKCPVAGAGPGAQEATRRKARTFVISAHHHSTAGVSSRWCTPHPALPTRPCTLNKSHDLSLRPPSVTLGWPPHHPCLSGGSNKMTGHDLRPHTARLVGFSKPRIF